MVMPGSGSRCQSPGRARAELNMVTASETGVAVAPAQEATRLPEPQEALPSQVSDGDGTAHPGASPAQPPPAAGSLLMPAESPTPFPSSLKVWFGTLL